MSRKRRPDQDTSARPGHSAASPKTVKEAIDDALLETLKMMWVLTERLTKPEIEEKDVLGAMPELRELARRAEKLATFSNPSSTPLNSQLAVRLATFWKKTNPPESEIDKILQMAGRRRRGRPATLRRAGLQALELRSIEPGHWTWDALRDRLCNCGATQHGFKCRENLRREALGLKKALKDLGVKLPT